jgi:Flp pilus assembly protein TadD
LEQAVQLNPADPTIQSQLAITKFYNGLPYEEAWDNLIALTSRFPEAYKPHHNLGLLALLHKDYRLAISEFTIADRLEPSNAEAIGGMILSLLAQQKNLEAYNQAIAATERFPSNPYLIDLQAQALIPLGKFDLAIEAAQKAIKLNPTVAIFYTTLGKAYQGNRQFELASQSFRSALNINPNEGNAAKGLKQISIFLSPKP